MQKGFSCTLAGCRAQMVTKWGSDGRADPAGVPLAASNVQISARPKRLLDKDIGEAIFELAWEGTDGELY